MVFSWEVNFSRNASENEAARTETDEGGGPRTEAATCRTGVMGKRANRERKRIRRTRTGDEECTG